MTERFFFALWPESEQRRALVRLQRESADPRGRFPCPEDLHLTLAFLGPLGDRERRAALEAGDRVRSDPFAITLDRLGCFPRARVLWCGPTVSPPALLDLVRRLDQHLQLLGLPRERRPYVPHLTLARRVSRVPTGVQMQPISWSVREFVLAYGRSGSSPRYRIQKRWPLIP